MMGYLDEEKATQDSVLKISYVEFPAKDLPATQIFYEKVFGWHFSVHGPKYCTFNDDMLDGGFYLSSEHSSVEKGAALIVLYSKNIEAAPQPSSGCRRCHYKGDIQFPTRAPVQICGPKR